MTSTAHEDQFRSEPGLEDECRKARAKAKDVCVWDASVIPLTVQCVPTRFIEFYSLHYSFCPYCGKKIEVRE